MQKFTEKLHAAKLAFTFQDVILLPGWTEVEPREVDLRANVTADHQLNIPFVSSPMDTVTESEMAIAMARHGGLGVLHRNCTVEEQVDMAKRVKRAESLVIRDVVTIDPEQTIAYAISLMQKHGISGLPVVANGKLVGILTGRDVRFADLSLKIEDVMTKKVVTATDGISIEDAKNLMHRHRIEKLPLVDSEGRLKGLITVKDITLRGSYPNAVRDEDGRLLCAAAVSPFDLARAKALDKHVDMLVTDVAHFHNSKVFEAVKKMLPEVETKVIVGNIGTYEAAVDVATKLEGIAGIRVGIGSGSICTTSEVTKTGAPTLFATAHVADALAEYGLKAPIIADGGIRSPGDAALALSVGALTVMIGNLFARCKESPGSLVSIGGRYYKQYRGMGSVSALEKRYALDRYSHPAKGIAEGVEGWVPYKGSLSEVVNELVLGLKASFGYVGARNIKELQEKARLGFLTLSGVQETKAHDILLPGEKLPEAR